MSKKLGTLGLLGALVLSGCYEKIEPQSSETIGHGASVSRLFEIDGCRVYRFTDRGYERYFSNCGDLTTTSSSYRQMQGKIQVTKTEEITAWTPKAKYEK